MAFRPVFSNESRDRDIEDATTVSRKKYVDIDKPSSVTLGDVVTRQEAEHMVEQAIARTAEITRDQFKKQKEDNEDAHVISSKTVKDLQNIASIFNSLKDFSSNPLQKKIEEKVGDMAAGVVERSFSSPSQHQEKDIIDRILNSQFAAGLGAGLGQRGPELVDTFTKNFGVQKVDGWISGAVKPNPSGVAPGSGVPGYGPGPGALGLGVESTPKSKKQENIDMLLALSPNNAEHVTAYAESQGNIPVDVARKMLMIHQDAIIKQMSGVSTGNPSTGGNLSSEEERIRNEQFVRELQEREVQKSAGTRENVVDYRRPIASSAQVMETLIPVGAEGPIIGDDKWSDDIGEQVQQPVQQPVQQQDTPNTIPSDQMALLTDFLQKMSVEISTLRNEIEIIKKPNVQQEKESTTVHHIKNIKRQSVQEEQVKEE